MGKTISDLPEILSAEVASSDLMSLQDVSIPKTKRINITNLVAVVKSLLVVELAGLSAAVQTKLGYLAAPDAGWIAPTFTNSWVNYDTTYNQCGYRKDAMGYVHLRGLVKSGTDGSSIFQLPVGYRPEKRELLVCASEDHYGRLDIPQDGTVVANAGTTSPVWVCLDGITFKAYQ